jgi:peptide/nickel transport system permease protein
MLRPHPAQLRGAAGGAGHRSSARPGILVEAILSFLGVGLPPDIPTWGNVMAEGRAQFNEYPHNIFFPGVFLAVTVLAVNILGDGLRDTLDPKMAKRV